MTNIHPLTRAIRGAGGGGQKQQRAPIESPDSLRSIAYARILDLVSEGEIVGFADQAHPLRCVYFNETPVENSDGSFNFKNFSIESRTGTQTQDYIPGFGGVESENQVGVELTASTPWTRNYTNTNINAVRIRLSTPAMSQTNTSNGDITGTTVSYKIELSVDGGAFATVLQSSFTGKCSGKYERSHRIDLPPANTQWTLRVVRLTADSGSTALQNKTYVEGFTEIIDVKLRMPMSAVVGVVVDSEQFNSIPSRAYKLRGRIVKVPSNYNPDTRTYTGFWNGTFQSRYTTNPAWVFYDMATNPRYGLGHLLSADLIDKWALYQIGVYCDQLVPDGFGGMEPRFTANIYLQSQNDALKVMQDLATMFRGIMYASGGAITAVGDMPSDPIYTYTPANVIDGKFTYSGSSRKVRHTVALVSWSDMSDFGRAKIEYVDDPEGISRYGIQPTEVIAVGCTSRGQARRMGKYILTTERYETDMVAFSVGMDGVFPAPGKVINIADPMRAGRRTGGRIRSSTINSITVDSLPIVEIGHDVTVILPNGKAEKRTVNSIIGDTLGVSVNFSDTPVAQSVWLIESPTLAAQRFRVLGVAEATDGIGYSVNAIQHVEGKFDYVEQNILIEEPPISDMPGKVVFAPSDILMTHRDVADQNTTQKIVTLAWTPVQEAVYYNTMYRLSEGSWVDVGNSTAPTIDIQGMPPGIFEVTVTAINGAGVRSQPAYAGPFEIDPNSKAPGFLTGINADIANALLTAQNAQAAADGAVVSFWQPNPPPIGTGAGQASTGDIWFDTDDGNRIYRVVSGSWVDAQDDQLAQAIAAASTAQATADGKVRLFVGPSAPTSGQSLHDQWFNTTTSVLMYWNGSAWVPVADQTSMTTDQMVLNPYFEQGMLHWVQDSNWYAEASTNAAIAGTGMIHAAGPIVNSRLRSTRSFPVSPGQRVFVTGMARNIGGSATGDLSIGILWRDAAGNEIAEAGGYFSKSAAMPGTEWRQLTRTCYAPNRAVLGSVHATVWNHTAGFWAVDNIRCKLIDDNAAVSPSGDNMVPNHAFSQDAEMWPTSTVYNEVGAPIAAGWDVREAGGSLRTSIQTGLEPNGGGRMLFIGNIEGVSAAGDYSYTNVHSRQKFSVAQGERFYIETSVDVAIGSAMPAGLTFTKYIGLWCYNSNDQYVGFVGHSGGLNSLVWAGTVTIPEGTAYVRIGAGAAWQNNTGSAINVPWATAHMRVQWIKIRRVANLDQGLIEHGIVYGKTANADLYDVDGLRRVGIRVKGSRHILGGPRNSRSSLVAGANSVRTTTALTAVSTGVIHVNAHSLELNGETVAYSAVTNAITGLTPGSTYVVYTIDPYLDGGVRTYHAQTNILSFQQAGEGAIHIGTITVPTSGSGGGGGSGIGPPAEWCVDYDTVLPDGRYVRDLRLGDEVLCIDVATGETGMFPLRAMGFGEEECYRLVTPELHSVIQSKSTPMDLPDGRVCLTPEMLGKPVWIPGKLSMVADLEYLGVRKVLKPDFGNRMFFAGERAYRTIATHNGQMKP